MIKKFTAPSVKEAIQLAKEHFGDDAIILQTKKAESGSGEPSMFELTAMSEDNSGPAPTKPAKIIGLFRRFLEISKTSASGNPSVCIILLEFSVYLLDE